MGKWICPKCQQVHADSVSSTCPACGGEDVRDFQNSDEYLQKEVASVLKERKELGLDGLVKGLSCVIINTEPDHQKATAEEFLKFTGLDVTEAFEDAHFRTVVLATEGSADFLIRSRKAENPFLELNTFPKSEHLPNTRLETFVFETTDIEKYVSIQKKRGIEFLTEDIFHCDNYSFIQTIPSQYTGNSIGFIQWRQRPRCYAASGAKPLDWKFHKTDGLPAGNVKELDHAATRVRAEDRDAAIIEFMNLTNYKFDFAIYVKIFNSITNVARFSSKDFAMVFTSGIAPYFDDETSGPTEKFVHNYGPRVHHIAFRTEEIEQTVSALKNEGLNFLLDLAGSVEEGLKQIFSSPSEHTLLVNEYIHRYGDFDGFFTRSNVTLLTGATAKQ